MPKTKKQLTETEVLQSFDSLDFETQIEVFQKIKSRLADKKTKAKQEFEKLSNVVDVD